MSKYDGPNYAAHDGVDFGFCKEQCRSALGEDSNMTGSAGWPGAAGRNGGRGNGEGERFRWRLL